MAENCNNTSEDAEMTDCDGEKVVTMMDVLQEQQEFEENANAVLGASDDKNCTYSKGYIKRQAIYACLTCCTEAKDDPSKRACVCLACSLNCHENHDLVELYTKRHLRCDCGNAKFSSNPCQLEPNKSEFNEDNKYNQNFSGLYCTCHRPYPDTEATFEDEMIQCIICEDWLHSAHLEATVPGNDQYAEMICKACMECNDFLHDYKDFAANIDNEEVDVVSGIKESTSDSVEKENIINGQENHSDSLSPEKSAKDAGPEIIDQSEKIDDSTEKQDESNELANNDQNADNALTENKNTPVEPEKEDETSKTSVDNIENQSEPDNNTAEQGSENKMPIDDEAEKADVAKDISDNEANKTNLDKPEHSSTTIQPSDTEKDDKQPDINKRRLSTEELAGTAVKKQKTDIVSCTRPKGIKRIFKGATFWPSNFRQKLCTCNECMTMYKDLSVLFLIDLDDTVTAYETLGMDKVNGTPTSQYEKGLQALSSLDRVQQINALTEYNKMRDKLLDFLKSFKDRKEVVKEEDIKSFFAGIKPKREPDGVYFFR